MMRMRHAEAAAAAAKPGLSPASEKAAAFFRNAFPHRLLDDLSAIGVAGSEH